MIPPIFVISLARATERRADITRRLDAESLQYEIVDAVDGRELNRADYADRLEQYDSKEGSVFRLRNYRNRYDCPLNGGEIGCYLSHYNLWQRIADEKIPAAVILEDDSVWDSDFAEIVAKAAACDWEWDWIQLYSGQKKRVYRVLQSLHSHYNLVQLKGTNGGTTAYLISLAAAEKLVRHCYLMHHAVDVTPQDYWNWSGRVYAVRPYPCSVRGVVSTIGDGEVYPGDYQSSLGLWNRIRFFLVKQKYWAINRFCRFWIRPKRK